MKTATVLILAILAQAAGNIYLSKGMRHLASLDPMGDSHSLLLLIRSIETPTIWLGTGLLLIFFLLYSAALSWADLSFVLPASAFGYVVNVAFAYYFLNEPVPLERWIGTVLISIGVILVSKSGARTVETGSEKEMILTEASR